MSSSPAPAIDRPILSKCDFVAQLRLLGIVPGELLHVHSSLKALGPVEGGAEGIIHALIEAVGPRGLVSVPTHTWAVVNDAQPVFHQTWTPSNVGLLTNTLRNWPGAIRSIHPTHSVAAIGPRAGELLVDHQTTTTPCCPHKSPYGRLLQWGGKVLFLGVDLTRCTYFHCLEEIAGLGEMWSVDPVARHRVLISHDNTTTHVQFHGHTNGKSDNYGRAEGDLIAAGAVRKSAPGEAPIMVVDARASADYLVPRFRANPHFFW